MIEERYIAATKAQSLHEDVNAITQVDVIKASGMSQRNLSAHYMRLISKPTREDLRRVYAALLHVVDTHKLQTGAAAIELALEWLLDPVCKVCKGTGVVVKSDREHKCPKCKGERYRKEPSCRDAQALIDYVHSCKRSHLGEMLGRLR